jgi:hypothetical protein
MSATVSQWHRWWIRNALIVCSNLYRQHLYMAVLAQLVERKALNLVVQGSSPWGGDSVAHPFCILLLVQQYSTSGGETSATF